MFFVQVSTWLTHSWASNICSHITFSAGSSPLQCSYLGKIPWTEEPVELQSMGPKKELDMTSKLKSNTKYGKTLWWCKFTYKSMSSWHFHPPFPVLKSDFIFCRSGADRDPKGADVAGEETAGDGQPCCQAHMKESVCVCLQEPPSPDSRTQADTLPSTHRDSGSCCGVSVHYRKFQDTEILPLILKLERNIIERSFDALNSSVVLGRVT